MGKLALMLITQFAPFTGTITIKLKHDPLPCSTDAICKQVHESKYANQCYEDMSCRFGVYTVTFRESPKTKKNK
jgi:hypothetical protein